MISTISLLMVGELLRILPGKEQLHLIQLHAIVSTIRSQRAVGAGGVVAAPTQWINSEINSAKQLPNHQRLSIRMNLKHRFTKFHKIPFIHTIHTVLEISLPLQ